MANPDAFAFHPELDLSDELTGIEAADAIAAAIDTSGALGPQRMLTTEERASILEMIAPGAAHFAAIARLAGELAGEGDIIGAISLMGGIDNARELIGDETLGELLAELGHCPDNYIPDMPA